MPGFICRLIETFYQSGSSISIVEEKRLVSELIRRKGSAWRTFVDDYGPRIYTACLYTLKHSTGQEDRHLAEDIAQNVMAQLVADDFKVLKSFSFHSRLSTWLIAVARNQTLMHLRKKNLPTRELKEEVPAPVTNNESLRTVMASLPERDGKLLRLYYFDNWSFKEIAKDLQISENSVSPLLMRARERLRDVLIR